MALRERPVADALIPLAALAILIGGSLALFGLAALDGPIQVALICSCAIASLVYYGIQVLSPGFFCVATAAITAGAVISGAYLGDKLSPLSETTILTSQMVGVDLYTHVRSQAWNETCGSSRPPKPCCSESSRSAPSPASTG